MLLVLSSLAAVMWLGLLALPWRPWSTRERIEADPSLPSNDLKKITVLIPARNEAVCIRETLNAVDRQGPINKIVLVDDQSDDGTAEAAESLNLSALHLVRGQDPEANWSGKLWALHQGFEHVDTPYVLLLDADIELSDGMLPALLDKLEQDRLDSISVMAHLYMGSWAEKLLLPPFIYFFKLIYPFKLANTADSRVAAAAGGCVLLRAARLEAIGGFDAVKEAIIDDCTLARKIKDDGGKIWLGLSHGVRAIRPYEKLSTIWNMVARTAYTQLHYSVVWLIACTILMVIGYIVPIAVLIIGSPTEQLCALVALLALWGTYLPTVKFYGLPLWWVLTLPLAAALFLAMTWTSAIRYARGERSRWKNRTYIREPAGQAKHP